MLDPDRNDEAWRLIIPYLRNPIPLPLSAPPRSALHQPSLCAAIQTCRLFQTLAEPILYREIATDRFFHMINDSTNASIRRRMQHTVRLYIEYSPKGQAGQGPLYSPIMRDGPKAWKSVAEPEVSGDERMFEEYKQEMRDILPCFLVLDQMGVRAVFKRLESIAISSIYGRDTDAYILFESHTENVFKKAVATVGTAAAAKLVQADMALHQSADREWKLFLKAANPQHFCSRDTNGVLNLDRLNWVSEGKLPRGDCRMVFHFNSLIHQIPVVFGRSVVWASDVPLNADWSIPIEEVGKMLADDADIRRALAAKDRRGERAEIDLYSSTAIAKPLADPNSQQLRLHPATIKQRVYDAKAQRWICDVWLQEKITEVLESFGWGNDSIKWRPSFETPVCQACGSGIPGKRKGQWATGKWTRLAESEEGMLRIGDDEPIPEDRRWWQRGGFFGYRA